MIGCRCIKDNFAGRILREIFEKFRKELESWGVTAYWNCIIGTNKLFHQWHLFKEEIYNRGQLKQRTKLIRLKIEHYLRQGMLSKNRKTAGTCRHILSRKEALWQFIEVENIEPTNNTAERILRMLVIWRKTSFGTQSPRGSLHMERIMSVVATCRLQGKNTLEYLTVSVRSHLLGDVYPSLIPLAANTSSASAA